MMSNSMFDKDKLIIPNKGSNEITPEQIEAARAQEAKDQFDKEVRRYESLVLGKEDLKPKKLGGRTGDTVEERLDALEKYAGDMQSYCGTLEGVIKSFIYQNVVHMRGIALQGQKVNENALKAANLASESMNGTQKLVEVYGARQVALNRALHDIDFVLQALIDDSVSENDIPNKLDPDSGAAKDLEAVNLDFLEGETRLIRRAQQNGLLTEDQVTEMLAKTVRQHGNATAERATQEPKKQKFTDRIVKTGKVH